MSSFDMICIKTVSFFEEALGDYDGVNDGVVVDDAD